MIRVSIIGVTGYTGQELVRYLLRHPEAELVHCTSESSPGLPLSSIFPEFSGRCGLITEKADVSRIARDSDIAFSCLPHGGAGFGIIKGMLSKEVRVIDLSADFRLKSAALYRSWYGVKHPYPALLKESVYGLPEIYRDKIVSARLIANPGCYATASILSVLPLARTGLAKKRSVIIDAKSGVSGAGKKMLQRYLFCETNENFLAYSVNGHRHVPEIEQELKNSVTFVPHLLPVNRGILTTVYADLNKEMSSGGLRDLFCEFYGKENFVCVLPDGTYPEIKSVNGSNFCHIGVAASCGGRRAIVLSAIDNLGKGASSQAIQNMNVMFSLDEKCGLM